MNAPPSKGEAHLHQGDHDDDDDHDDDHDDAYDHRDVSNDYDDTIMMHMSEFDYDEATFRRRGSPP